jgi:hypothetical protein
MRVWSVGAIDNPNDLCRSAEHAVAADRLAREIVDFLTGFAVRLRRLSLAVRRQLCTSGDLRLRGMIRCL